MTVALTMIVKDEAAVLPRTLPTYAGLIDSAVILDTGSTDGTPELVCELLDGLPCEVHQTEWTDYGSARTKALDLARGSADWLFMPDADMECRPVSTAEYQDTFTLAATREFLAPDPDPSVDAWQVEVEEGGHVWRKPLLLRGDQEWRYLGAAHEFLDTAGRNVRALIGLKLHHERHGSQEGKFDRYMELLAEDAERGEPRAVFYTAECLRFSGRTQEAVTMYQHRASIVEGFDEERWYATYQAAKLTDDVAALLECWEARPWRHEPLTAAARLVAQQGPSTDALFLEPAP